MKRKRRRLPKKFRARSVSDEQKLEDARRIHHAAESAVFRAVGRLAQARELVSFYERKLGLDLKARSELGLVDLAKSKIQHEARGWLDRIGLDASPGGGEPSKKAGD